MPLRAINVVSPVARYALVCAFLATLAISSLAWPANEVRQPAFFNGDCVEFLPEGERLIAKLQIAKTGELLVESPDSLLGFSTIMLLETPHGLELRGIAGDLSNLKVKLSNKGKTRIDTTKKCKQDLSHFPAKLSLDIKSGKYPLPIWKVFSSSKPKKVNIELDASTIAYAFRAEDGRIFTLSNERPPFSNAIRIYKDHKGTLVFEHMGPVYHDKYFEVEGNCKIHVFDSELKQLNPNIDEVEWNILDTRNQPTVPKGIFTIWPVFRSAPRVSVREDGSFSIEGGGTCDLPPGY